MLYFAVKGQRKIFPGNEPIKTLVMDIMKSGALQKPLNSIASSMEPTDHRNKTVASERWL
jgi:hypothetical protein